MFGRVGVLMGGWSSEKDISLQSGEAVLTALCRSGVDAVAVHLQQPGTCKLDIENAQIDLAFVALHGLFGEDGQVQQILEELNIPYTGSSVISSMRAMNKAEFRHLFLETDIRLPEGVVVESIEIPTELLPKGPPWFVKPATGGSSIGINFVSLVEDLPHAVSEALTYSAQAIIESYIPGREITVSILEEKPLVPVEIIPKNRFYDFSSKYGEGTKYLVPAPIDEEISIKAQNSALTIHQRLGCRGFSRVDMILDDNGELCVLELNTIPGLTDKSLLPKAAAYHGISFDELCLKILGSARRVIYG